jgi:hypothetical protein
MVTPAPADDCALRMNRYPAIGASDEQHGVAARVGEGGGIAPPKAELQADGATSLRQIAAGLDAKEYRLRGARARGPRSR